MSKKLTADDFDEDLELMENIESLKPEDFDDYMFEIADRVVNRTQGDSWDDPEDYQLETVELAHLVYRILKEKYKGKQNGNV